MKILSQSPGNVNRLSDGFFSPPSDSNLSPEFEALRQALLSDPDFLYSPDFATALDCALDAYYASLPAPKRRKRR